MSKYREDYRMESLDSVTADCQIVKATDRVSKPKSKRRASRENLTDWRAIENEREKYAAYLCSREWGVLKEAVHKRSGGTCERCGILPGNAVHHLTYERKYQEELDDLQHICHACHEFTHGKSEYDPIGHSESDFSYPGLAPHVIWTRYLLNCRLNDLEPVCENVAHHGWSSYTRMRLVDKNKSAIGICILTDTLLGSASDTYFSVEQYDGNEACQFNVGEYLEYSIDILCAGCNFQTEISMWIRMRCPTVAWELYDESIRQVRKCLPATPTTRR